MRPAWSTACTAPRQSIMNRPIKEPSKSNVESMERQYVAEDMALRRRREQYMQQEAERLRAIHGTREEKREIAQKLASELDTLISERKAQESLESQESRRHALETLERVKYEEMLEQEQKEARRAYEEYVAEQNRRAIAERKDAQERARQEEVAEERTQPSFFANHFMKSTR
ncbi:hypothetical protein QR46_3642 [Giardia duodenalis assemblage B]|uniref:Meiosis-specific nuclear structural protein 1 n=1 Tax=Giardia duodenalis assemblage B TaxID=1394984 RepID=A0A132NQU9_GIAIN|nr:hypothetical protein QR46_3642 [Giardia intestinalis assemblage B]